MKALAIRRYKAPMEMMQLPRPEPGPGDLLVRVRAASVNPVDFKIRDGGVKVLIPYSFPLILGNDLAGDVEAVGPGVTKFRAGDAIYSRLDKDRIGAFAEYALVRESAAATKPARLDYVAGGVAAAGGAHRLAGADRSRAAAGRTEGADPRRLGRRRHLRHPARQAPRRAGGDHRQRQEPRAWCGRSARMWPSTTRPPASRTWCATGRGLRHPGRRDAAPLVRRGQTGRRGGDGRRPARRQVRARLGPQPAAGLDPRVPEPQGRSPRQKKGARFEYLFMHASGEQLEKIGALVDQGVIKTDLDETFRSKPRPKPSPTWNPAAPSEKLSFASRTSTPQADSTGRLARSAAFARDRVGERLESPAQNASVVKAIAPPGVGATLTVGVVGRPRTAAPSAFIFR